MKKNNLLVKIILCFVIISFTSCFGGGNADKYVGSGILPIIIIIVIIAVLREVNCWYWKINKRIELMEKQNKLLENIFYQLGGNPLNKTKKANNNPIYNFCKKCGKKLEDNITGQFCESCEKEKHTSS